ncbi:hypothetical protein D9C73_016647 [Collichthys lucidus]|uniref:Uncharacterized protein n=1 Tax=Collichthys lucidus TaxID=240159 RepID=A0A4U5V4T8_COLLU|nr:hypothetical protein D9C73_016647 [Collichthys lucidus]
MEDIGLLPKPTNDPPVHRPTVTETFGLHQDYLHLTDHASRKSDGPSNKKRSHPGTAQPQMMHQFQPQNAGPLGAADTSFLNTASKNGNTNLDKAGTGRKKPKAKLADPSKWKQNKQKQLRMEGKAYVSKRKKDGEVVTKQPRAVGPRCNSTACKKASNRLCNEINEEVRRKVFDEFWQDMNWAQRKQYVAGQVDCDPVERSRAAGSQVEEIGFSPLSLDGGWQKETSVQEHVPVHFGGRRVVCAQLGTEWSHEKRKTRMRRN